MITAKRIKDNLGCGDLNGHIRNGEQGIRGNKEQINVNGRRVLELAKDREVEIVNNMGRKCGKVDKDRSNKGYLRP